MGEAKQKNAKHLEAQDRSQREDAMHKRAQRAEGDLLKARAHIAQLEAEAREARDEREEWMRAIDQANKNGQQYEALRKQLTDEKAISDALKVSLTAYRKRITRISFDDAIAADRAEAAYRKARVL